MRGAPRIATTFTAFKAGACRQLARCAMFTSRRVAGIIAVAALTVAPVALAQQQQQQQQQQQRPAPPKGPGLGVPAPPAEIARVDISIPPDGAGLPEGSGTA